MRLTLPHRYRRIASPRHDAAPWPAPPLSVVAHLELDEAAELAKPYADPDPRFELWLEVEGDWQMVRFGAGGAVKRAAWVLPFHRCIPTPYDDLDEAPPRDPAVARELEAAARSLLEGIPAAVRIEGDAEALAAEVERVRPFYTGRGLGIHLGGDAPRAGVEAALTELGLRPASDDARLYHLKDRDAGEWEPLLSVRLVDDAVTTLRVVVDLETETVAPEARVELAVACAEELARRFDLELREAITGLTEPGAILDAARATIALLAADGQLHAFEELPRPLPLGAREATRVAPDEPQALDLTGHVLVCDVASGTRRASLMWFAVAAVATVVTLSVHVLGLFVAMGAIAMAVRALPAQGKARAAFDALHVDLDGDEQRYPFPLQAPEGMSEEPWTDADGTPIRPSPATFPAPVQQALRVRSKLYGHPIVELLAHEACWLSDSSWRGRRDGWVGVALSPDASRALGVFPDREAYDAFAETEEPHRLVGAYAEDASGKGASIGLPTEVDPDLDPARLPSHAEAFP